MGDVEVGGQACRVEARSRMRISTMDRGLGPASEEAPSPRPKSPAGDPAGIRELCSSYFYCREDKRGLGP